MSYNFINEASSITTSNLCAYDTARGYETDFNTNGDVDGWDYFDGIHTYGAWDGFLFGTLYGSYALIGRTSVFAPVSAETHYTLRITMKINTVERVGSQVLPTTGRIMWVTTSNPVWGSDKQMDFTIYTDNLWHTYVLNVGEEQWWQGDIRNLRIYPVYEDGRDGDEFFIKTIQIVSVDTYNCFNPVCSYYSNYSHPCGGIGSRGYCQSSSTGAEEYTIEAGVNDELIVDINDYGDEIIKLDGVSSATGEELIKIIAKSISKVGVGGYAETEVNYTEDGEFKIYSGTYVSDSTAVIKNSNAAVTLGFFDSDGNDLSSKGTGTTPADKFKSASSFKIKTFQLLSLFTDNNVSFKFDPTLYNVEGGRVDWFEGGMGSPELHVGDLYTSTVSKVTRYPPIIDNANKTIIDFCHPFNASGRIKKISLMCTLDQGYETPPKIGIYQPAPGEDFAGRLEATGCKVKIFRPRRDGTLKTITSVDIPDRDYSGGKLLSIIQESVQIDCDIWVNKGDLIGVYNAHMHLGKSISGAEVDALYYHVDGEATGEFDPGKLYGDGIGGLLVYARSDESQKRLSIDVDFGNRINVEEVNVIGTTETRNLEFNVARCLDINWSVDLFGGTHYTGHVNTRLFSPRLNEDLMFWHTNEAYGINCLDDGILTPTDALAADSFTVNVTNESTDATHNGSPTPGITVTNARYFFCNGDGEWLGVYTNKGSWAYGAWVEQFSEDPITFTLLFPHGTTKKIYKSRVYFKDRYNFRSFALSVSYDLNDVLGNADIPNFYLIEEYTAVTLDDRRIEKDGPGYDQIDHYLFTNPCNGHPVVIATGERIDIGGKWAYPGYLDDYEGYIQSTNTDWNVLTHEFDTIECKGFRFYCDYHESTKINEMELYCMVEDVGSSMISSVNIIHSHYNDLWWSSTLTENADNSVTAYIGDTSRYFSIDIEPVSTMNLNNIRFDIKKDAVFVGAKGCELQLLPVHSKLDAVNQGQSVDIKNIYGDGFDLYVDIAKDTEYDEGLVFYSRLNNTASITNPEVGADARYKKEEDYPLVNYNKNCAINNECYGLRNLIDGKKAYYSYLDDFGYQEFGTLSSGVSIDFTNIPAVSMTVINVPVLSRNRYWKFGWLCGDHPAMNVNEIKLFYEDVELEADFYHDKNLEYEVGPISDTAPHLNNDSPLGSYYQLKGDHHIGFDLGGQETIDKIVLFHNSISNYSDYYCGIDDYTDLYITLKDENIVDYSYNERSLTVDNGIDIDIGRWSRNEEYVATSVDGLWGTESLSTVTSGTLSSEPLYADGDRFGNQDDSSGHPLNAHDSHGIDFGTPTQINKLSFYGYMPEYGNVSNTLEPMRVYKSDDGVNWILVQEFYAPESDVYTTKPYMHYRVGTSDGGYNMAFELAFDSNHTARYFKLYVNALIKRDYSGTPYYVREIEGGVQTETPEKKGIRFPGTDDDYITTPDYTVSYYMYPAILGYGLDGPEMTVDFWVKFDSLPASGTGDYVTLVSNWDGPLPDRADHQVMTSYEPDKEFILVAREENGSVELEYWIQYHQAPFPAGWRLNHAINFQTPDLRTVEIDKWYYIQFFSYIRVDSFNRTYCEVFIYVNGERWGVVVINDSYGSYHSTADNDLVIGKNLDGIISDFRVSTRRRFDFHSYYWGPKEHHYAMSFYASDDNTVYGKYCDLDTRYDNSYHYYDSNNKYSEYYSSYLAIDLGRRYDLDWIRSYGDADRYELSFYGTNKTALDISNADIDDINQITFSAISDDTSEIVDARWLRISLYNGDDVERVIRKLGLYPDINTLLSPGGTAYNHEWDSIGTSITSYGSEENIAFNTTVSGSYFGMQYTGKAVNGVIPENTDFRQATLDDVWCSETESNPWITIDLGEVYEIYRIKIHHGYDGEDTKYLITDYTVRTSTDGQSFTTRFTITSNSSFERTHDLSTALSARYVKIDITGYDSENVYLRTDMDGGTAVFNGAALREIEVYESYSFESVNSEEYPIICMNLQDQFYLESHSIIGFDVEDSSGDWSNDDSNFCYSDAVLDNPSKVDFRAWGGDPVYDQWFAVKMDTAENYNSGPHYLKHVRIEAITGKNPCEYPWWWSSNVSTLSRDYDYHVTNSVSAVRIDYPATDVSETISFIEGDNFGIDEYAAFRDGFNFRIRIDDIDNLDMSYGYFYFGGYDSTDGYNPVVHKWNFNTLSGILDTGWNDLFLRFKDADELDYTVPTNESLPDVRIPSTITFGTLGMVFRGVGNPLTMHLDGFYIRRNHFNDYVAYGNGIYLTGKDYLVCPIGEFDLSLGTIELWLRPDFDDDNYDFYHTLKNRAIFQFNNNANDVFGLMSTYNGLEVYSGNLTDGIKVLTLTGLGISVLDVTFHLGIVFSNDGTQIDNDGSTIRVYLNNILIAKSNITWDIYDNKHFQFVLGGQGPLALKEGGWTNTSSTDAVVSNLRIYNYCKTDFEKSILDREDAADDLIKPSNLIEISKNNLTYYKVGDADLPFKFPAVPFDTVTSVYVRTDVPSSLVGKEKRTGGLLVYWDMAI